MAVKIMLSMDEINMGIPPQITTTLDNIPTCIVTIDVSMRNMLEISRKQLVLNENLKRVLFER